MTGRMGKKVWSEKLLGEGKVLRNVPPFTFLPYLTSINEISLAAINFCVARTERVIFIAEADRRRRNLKQIAHFVPYLSVPPTHTSIALPISRKYDSRAKKAIFSLSYHWEGNDKGESVKRSEDVSYQKKITFHCYWVITLIFTLCLICLWSFCRRFPMRVSTRNNHKIKESLIFVVWVRVKEVSTNKKKPSMESEFNFARFFRDKLKNTMENLHKKGSLIKKIFCVIRVLSLKNLL